jgi:hypothetical protein
MESVNAYHRRALAPEWIFNGNGVQGPLVVNMQADGKITGTVYGQQRIIGFLDQNTNPHKIIFMRMENPADPSSFQIFKGIMFPDTGRAPNGVPTCFHILAGEMLTPAGAGGSAQSNEFGWYAKQQTLCD